MWKHRRDDADVDCGAHKMSDARDYQRHRYDNSQYPLRDTEVLEFSLRQHEEDN